MRLSERSAVSVTTCARICLIVVCSLRMTVVGPQPPMAARSSKTGKSTSSSMRMWRSRPVRNAPNRSSAAAQAPARTCPRNVRSTPSRRS